MRIQEFKYNKSGEPATDRKVLVLQETDDFVEGIDLGHLDQKEADELLALNEKVEAFLKTVINKSYRRFKKGSMS